jgi:hypothetical protein
MVMGMVVRVGMGWKGRLCSCTSGPGLLTRNCRLGRGRRIGHRLFPLSRRAIVGHLALRKALAGFFFAIFAIFSGFLSSSSSNAEWAVVSVGKTGSIFYIAVAEHNSVHSAPHPLVRLLPGHTQYPEYLLLRFRRNDHTYHPI